MIVVLAEEEKFQDDRLLAALDELRGEAKTRVAFLPKQEELGQMLLEFKTIGAKRVLVCGGDGTLHRVVEEMMDLQVSDRLELGVIPMGTANDFAKSSAFGAHDFVEAVRRTALAKAQKVDVGIVNGTPFINVVTAGVAAKVTTTAPGVLKTVLGPFAYYINALSQLASMESYSLEFRSLDKNDSWTIKEDCIAFAVGNGLTAGGGFRVAPHAKLNDGIIDILVIPSQSVIKLGALAAELLQERPDLSSYNVQYLKTSAFVVTSDKEIQLNLDGEPMKGTSFEFSVVPQALDFVVNASVVC